MAPHPHADDDHDDTHNHDDERDTSGGEQHADPDDSDSAGSPFAATNRSPATGAGPGAGPAEGLPLAPRELADLIRVVNAPDHEEWLTQVRRIGGCSHPLHMAGHTRRVDTRTGTVLAEYTSRGRPGGVVLVPCRNRRTIACPACASTYHGDTFHLVRAGLLGGKGVPASVATHPRIFLTLTAPGFGAVHTTHSGAAPCRPGRTRPCPHGRLTVCRRRHPGGDPILGAPLCPDCYDYPGAVIWQASIGALWSRFTIYLPRHLAHVTGVRVGQLRRQVRLSYVKIVEFQRRGLVHIHAVIRADGVPNRDHPADTPLDDQSEPAMAGADVVAPPGWVSAELLEQAARQAAAAVRIVGPVWASAPPESATAAVTAALSGRPLVWGRQIDVQDITTAHADGAEDGTGRRIALYVAKYATKGTEDTGWTGRGLDGTPRADHAERMVLTALELAPLPELAHLKLGRWARNLAYRGHVASKSRRYSTTMGALRAARADHARRQANGPDHHDDATRTDRTRPDGPADDGPPAHDAAVRVESSWRLVGHGYTPGQAAIAADVARDASLNRAASRDAGAAPLGGWVGPAQVSRDDERAVPASPPGLSSTGDDRLSGYDGDGAGRDCRPPHTGGTPVTVPDPLGAAGDDPQSAGRS